MSDNSPRLHYIDNLRIALTSLVVLHHVALTYGGTGRWYFWDPVTNELTKLVVFIFQLSNQAFFMGFFFLIAGYFVPKSIAQKGTKRFLVTRFQRLGIPLLCYAFVLNPVILVIRSGYRYRFSKSYLVYMLRHYANLPDVGPMWFALTLLIFSLAYVIVRRFFLVRRSKKFKFTPHLTASIVLAISLGVSSFLIRIWVPVGYLLPIANLRIASTPQYVVFFCIGIIAGQRGWQGELSFHLIRFWRWGLVLMVVGFGFFLAVNCPGNYSLFFHGFHWQTFVFAMWEQLYAVGLILVLLDVFRRYLNNHNPISRMAVANAYTVYIIHPLIIVVFALCLQPIAIHPLLKFLLLAITSLPISFGTSHLIRQLPITRRIL